MAEFVVAKAMMSLHLFTGMVTDTVVVKEGKKSGTSDTEVEDKEPEKKESGEEESKIVNIEPPINAAEARSSGQRARDTYLVTYRGGSTAYLTEDELPGDAKKKVEEDKKKRKAGVEVEDPKGPQPPKIITDLHEAVDDVKNEKISIYQAGDKAKDFASKMENKIKGLKRATDAGSDASSRLSNASKAIAAVKTVADNAVKNDDRKTLATVMSALEQMAEKLEEVSSEVSAGETKREGEEEQKPEGEGEGKKSAEKVSEGREFIYEKSLLSSAPWEGKIAEIEKEIVGEVKQRSQSEKASVNSVFFETTGDGEVGVFKPEGLGVPIGRARLGNIMNNDIDSSTREVASFDVDRVLGLGIVPPTFIKEEKGISRSERQDIATNLLDKFGHGLTPEQQLDIHRAEGAEQLTGSTQWMIQRASPAANSRVLDEKFEKNADFRFNVEKVAAFDFITGATDRHLHNILLDPSSDEVYAIDNGLNFTKTDESDPTGVPEFTSQPASLVKHHQDGKISGKILEHLKGVDKKQLKSVLEKAGLGQESKGVLSRLDYILEHGKIAAITNRADLHRPFDPKQSTIDLPSPAGVERSIDSVLCKSSSKRKMISADIWSGVPGKEMILGTIVFDGKRIRCVKGKENVFIQFVIRNGIIGDGGKTFTVKDGWDFVYNLPFAISGSYVQAKIRGK